MAPQSDSPVWRAKLSSASNTAVNRRPPNLIHCQASPLRHWHGPRRTDGMGVESSPSRAMPIGFPGERRGASIDQPRLAGRTLDEAARGGIERLPWRGMMAACATSRAELRRSLQLHRGGHRGGPVHYRYSSPVPPHPGLVGVAWTSPTWHDHRDVTLVRRMRRPRLFSPFLTSPRSELGALL